jgi:hypothetical protein
VDDTKSPAGKPLTVAMARFAELYAGPGTGAHTARLAGYRGTDGSLRTLASRFLGDPRVRAVIEARGVELPSESTDASSTEVDADELGAGGNVEPLEVLRKVAADPHALPGAKVRAAQLLLEDERKRGEEERGDPFAELRAKVNDNIRRIREREAETGCCSRCNQRLPDRDPLPPEAA